MAFVLPDELIEDVVAYIPTWDTAALLSQERVFCPLCQVPDAYTCGGTHPIPQLKMVIADIQAENALDPVGFLQFISYYYETKTRGQLINVSNWAKPGAPKVDKPEWPIEEIHLHFKSHKADPWFVRAEALRQTMAMQERMANTCLMKEGAPSLNGCRTFIELNKLRETLCLTGIKVQPH